MPSRSPSLGWSQAPASGLELTSTFDAFHNFNDGTLFYDFTKLPYVTFENTVPSVRGVLWSHVVNFQGGVTFTESLERVSSVYAGGHTRITVQTQLSETFRKFLLSLEPPLITARVPWPCQRSITCPPFGRNDILVLRADPVLQSPKIGLIQGERTWYVADEVDAVSSDLVALIDRLASGSEKIVVASEPWGRLEQNGNPIRAVTLDARNAVQSVLVIDALGDLAQFRLLECPECPRVVSSRLVFSADQARIFSFGDGRPTLIQYQLVIDRTTPSGFALEPTEFPLDNDPPGEVLAATWRMDDVSLYEVDRDGEVLKLRRWKYGAPQFEVLRGWPSAFSKFEEFYLSAGPEGDLIFSATRKNPAETVVVRLVVDDASGRVAVAGTQALHEATVAEPVVGPYAVQVLVTAGPDKLFDYQMVSFEQMRKGVGLWNSQLRP